MTRQKWNKITVIGCGLIGASFALAMKRAGACTIIAGWDESSSVLDEALSRGVIDEVDYSFARAGVSSADLIYLAMPVLEIIDFLRERGGQFKPGAIITDAGSTKAAVCRTARLCLPEDRHFVGGHPIAGSHQRGLAYASAELFTDAAYVLIKDVDEGERPATGALKETLDILGARVIIMGPDEHDRAMALISHLPQLASSALAAVVQDQPDRDALINVSGAGYREMTRLAASSWSVWRSILMTNPTQVAASLDTLIEQLSIVRDELRGVAEHGSDQLKLTERLFAKP